MRRSLSVAILLFVLAIASSAALADGPALVGSLEARKLIVDKEKGEIAVSAEKVYPQDKVEYILRYRNSGNAPASGVDLVGPIPDGTVYLQETATETSRLYPLFSIDNGSTYQIAPVTYLVTKADGTREEREATPDMITHVKWSLREDLGAGEEVIVSYRVQVK
ncbi:MAG: DUF11 domain-containing protein [Candidatus Krumholzibacteriota bacterium]|nr:DUF11 domain-containing protein [Candidatus Krumholzibacteriota bacterium]